MTLAGKHISLRALEATDLDFLFAIENDTKFWELSNTQTPYSRGLLQNYIQQAHQDIYEAKQFRFVIQNTENIPVGLIDLFDFDPKNLRVGIGIIVVETAQNKGYAQDALSVLCSYCFKHLNVHQVFANITNDNEKSIGLFKKLNFTQTGCKKEWTYSNGQFKDELFFQLLKTNHEA